MKRVLLLTTSLLSLLLASPFDAHTEDAYDEEISGDSAYDREAYPEFAPSKNSPLTYAGLKNLIKRKNVTSIDQLLPLLPLEYRKHFVLAYKSHSMQPASDKYPRVVFYGPNGKLLISISGDPKKPGYNSLEIIEWNEKNESFEFHEIEFKEKKPAVVRENPQSCLGCHGVPPRPNWEAYNGWRGFYGSLSRAGMSIIAKGSKEDKALKLYLKETQGKGRYKAVPPLKIVSVKKHLGKNYESYIGSDTDAGKHDPGAYIVANSTSNAANDQLTHFLYRLNVKRVARELVDSPNFQRYKYVLAALGLGCQDDKYPYRAPPAHYDSKTAGKLDIAKYFPEDLQKKGKSYKEYYEHIESTFLADHKKRDKALNEFNDTKNVTNGSDFKLVALDSAYSTVYSLARWRYLAERMDVNMNNWSMAFTDGTYALDSPIGIFYGDLQSEVKKRLKSDPDLKSYLTNVAKCSGGSYCAEFQALCEQLRAKSVTSLSEQNSFTQQQAVCPPNDPLGAKQTVQSIAPASTTVEKHLLRQPLALRACISCHAGPNASGPQIPFHAPEQMTKEQIAESLERMSTSDEALRMPQDSPQLSKQEQAAIKEYLESFNSK